MNSIKDLVDLGSEITGSAAATFVGLMFAGPPGAIAGAITGPLIGKTIHDLGDEIANRFLSTKEKQRIGAVITYAMLKIDEKIKNGLQIRNDDFFQKQPNGRIAADEIIEGILLSAQREHQEKKLQLQSNLLANIGFDKRIDRSMANFLIKLMTQLTYQQLCMLSIIADKEEFGITKRKIEAKDLKNEQESLLQELYSMFTSGIVRTTERGFYFDSMDINPNDLVLQGAGLYLYELMELHNMDGDDLSAVASKLRVL